MQGSRSGWIAERRRPDGAGSRKSRKLGGSVIPPHVALGIWLAGTLVVLKYDPGVHSRTSPVLWLPIAWIFLLGSRSPSQWLNGGNGEALQASVQAFNDGNTLDKVILLLLILGAVVVLAQRSFGWIEWISANRMLCAFLAFALLSVLWSDYPLVAVKRWFRDFGSFAMIWVVASDRRPTEAMSVVFRRVCYLLVSLSVVLIKYFPTVAIQYNVWTGTPMVSGVTTSKNNLGAVCLISGVFFVWDTIRRWPDRKASKFKRIIALNIGFLVLTIWLLHRAHSTTSLVCLCLGSAVLLATQLRIFRRRPGLLKALVPGTFFLYLILSFGLGLSGYMAQSIGKDPTLTDRTEIWSILLSMHTNPVFGTGYESFWLGHRLDWFWENAGQGQLNEAHNGYLEVYLEMGLIGDALICGLLLSSYRRIWRTLRRRESAAFFALAMWMVLIFYNMTEAAFEGTLMFVVFLMGTLILPGRTVAHRQNAGISKKRFENLPVVSAS